MDDGVVGDARCGSFDPFANGTIPGGGMTESVAQSLVNGDCPGHHNCIALDGDKLKPREDQRKGGNGFGINEEGAGYTLTGVDRRGVAYENDHLNRCEVARSLNGDHDDRVTDSGTSVVHVGMAQNTRDEVRIVGDGEIVGALPAEPGMKQQTYVVSTNSNGEDVAATINANMSKLGGDNQTTFGGGTASHAAMKERTMSHNFELYDNADEVSVSLSSCRASDTLVVREKEGAEGE